jgi:hypothetical protein
VLHTPIDQVMGWPLDRLFLWHDEAARLYGAEA